MNDELNSEKDLTLELDGEVYEVTAEYFYENDPNYGADIDGHRGVEVTFITDCCLLNAYRQLEDGTLEEVKDKGILRKLWALAENEG